MQTLTTALKAITESKSMDPSGLIKMAIDVLKKIQVFLKWIQGILQTVQDYAYVLIEYARIARAIVDYIASLPNRLRQFLRECLSKVVGGVMAVINALFSTSGVSSDFGDLKTEFSNTVEELNKTAREVGETIALPGQFIEALVNPSSAADQAKAEKEMLTFIDSNTKNSENIHNQTVYNKTSYSSP
jgi:hypothetical protein